MPNKPETNDTAKKPEAASSKDGTTTDITKSQPVVSPWAALEIGATVLWRSDPKEGWFECEVVGISKDKKTLTLKWRDYPTFKQFDVRRLAVGLICKVG